MGKKCNSKQKLDGKTIVITGASAGIGETAAMALAARGARIIMACRSVTKAQAVADEIKKETGNQAVLVMELDVSNMDNVRKFAKDFLATESQLHVLVNNAGAAMQNKLKSAQGFELTLATNHYGHFLLTNLLLGILKATPGARIVTVSSKGHLFCSSLPLDDLNYEKRSYGSTDSYCQSKLCNILFTRELAFKLQGTGVTANSLHPGFVSTDFLKKNSGLMTKFLKIGARLVGKTAMEGAQTTIHLAGCEKVEGISGEYYEECKKSKSSKLSRNKELAVKLWDDSEKAVNLQPEEKHY